jgi:hypothetical protein
MAKQLQHEIIWRVLEVAEDGSTVAKVLRLNRVKVTEKKVSLRIDTEEGSEIDKHLKEVLRSLKIKVAKDDDQMIEVASTQRVMRTQKPKGEL